MHMLIQHYRLQFGERLFQFLLEAVIFEFFNGGFGNGKMKEPAVVWTLFHYSLRMVHVDHHLQYPL